VLAKNNLIVSPDWRLPGGWNIGYDGSAIPPLPRDGDLREVIEYRRLLLMVQQWADPRYADATFCMALLQHERETAVNRQAVPYAGPWNHGGRHEAWQQHQQPVAYWPPVTWSSPPFIDLSQDDDE
jgi:hypothetical protein